jgi:hypothetical protein
LEKNVITLSKSLFSFKRRKSRTITARPGHRDCYCRAIQRRQVQCA